eukprot:scaffold643389_cov37-Prasinocladus_malaysianus.AAC.1
MTLVPYKLEQVFRVLHDADQFCLRWLVSHHSNMPVQRHDAGHQAAGRGDKERRLGVLLVTPGKADLVSLSVASQTKTKRP